MTERTENPTRLSLTRAMVAMVVVAIIATSCSDGGGEAATEDRFSPTDAESDFFDDTDRSHDEPADSGGFGSVSAEDEEGLFAPDPDPGDPNRLDDNTFENYGVRPFVDPDDDPLSTFALDVDTGSYTIARRWLSEGVLPEADSVRVEEFVNYFDYDYDAPRSGLEI